MRPGFINSFIPAVIQTGGAQPLPLPSDYWHVSNGSYSSSAFAPQQSVAQDLAGTAPNPIADGIWAAPFFVGRMGRTISALGARWTSAPATGAIIKLAIYDCLPATARDVYPQALVASVELTLANVTGVQTAALASPVSLPNGLYWIAVARRSGLQGQVARLNGATGNNQTAGRNPLQWTGATINTTLLGTLLDASAMPATFPAGAAINSGAPVQFEVL
jgi:hypothetical protein